MKIRSDWEAQWRVSIEKMSLQTVALSAASFYAEPRRMTGTSPFDRGETDAVYMKDPSTDGGSAHYSHLRKWMQPNQVKDPTASRCGCSRQFERGPPATNLVIFKTAMTDHPTS
jgi:hypothetical protein